MLILNLSDKLSDMLRSENVSKAFDKLRRDKKTLIIILVGISGMLIIMLAPSGDKTEKSDEQSVVCNYDVGDVQNEVRCLIESIKGAGRAEVYITYESENETVYAMNVDEKSDGNDIHIKSEYIITDDESGLVLKVLHPKVRGVAVVCQGGNDPVVKEKIYSVISALFDISTNKISVADMA